MNETNGSLILLNTTKEFISQYIPKTDILDWAIIATVIIALILSWKQIFEFIKNYIKVIFIVLVIVVGLALLKVI